MRGAHIPTQPLNYNVKLASSTKLCKRTDHNIAIVKLLKRSLTEALSRILRFINEIFHKYIQQVRGYTYKISCTRAIYKPRTQKDALNECFGNVS